MLLNDFRLNDIWVSRWVCCSSQWKTGQHSRETMFCQFEGCQRANLDVQLAASEVWRWPCIARISGKDCQGFWLSSLSELHMFHCSSTRTIEQLRPKRKWPSSTHGAGPSLLAMLRLSCDITSFAWRNISCHSEVPWLQDFQFCPQYPVHNRIIHTLFSQNTTFESEGRTRSHQRQHTKVCRGLSNQKVFWKKLYSPKYDDEKNILWKIHIVKVVFFGSESCWNPLKNLNNL